MIFIAEFTCRFSNYKPTCGNILGDFAAWKTKPIVAESEDWGVVNHLSVLKLIHGPHNYLKVMVRR